MSSTIHNVRSLIKKGPYRIVDPLVDEIFFVLARTLHIGCIPKQVVDSALTTKIISVASRDALRSFHERYMTTYRTMHPNIAGQLLQWDHVLINPSGASGDLVQLLSLLSGQYAESQKWGQRIARCRYPLARRWIMTADSEVPILATTGHLTKGF